MQKIMGGILMDGTYTFMGLEERSKDCEITHGTKCIWMLIR